MTETVKPWPTARNATPNAAVDFPLPFPVLTNSSPLPTVIATLQSCRTPSDEVQDVDRFNLELRQSGRDQLLSNFIDRIRCVKRCDEVTFQYNRSTFRVLLDKT